LLELTKDAVILGGVVSTKDEAIEQVGELLVKNGYITPEYIKSMKERESVANTYLGNGICIPHGMQKNKQEILKTGIAILQLPKGVDWKDGEDAHFVVGIAAKSDEHLQILAHLTNLLSDEEEAKKLAVTTDINLILQTLNGDEKNDNSLLTEEIFSTQKEVVLAGTEGFHARPATEFVDIVNGFKSEVRLQYQNKVANGRSIADILRLGISGGVKFIISAKGEDEQQTVDALCDAVENGLENELPEVIPVTVSKREYEGEKIEGVPAAPGIAIGPVIVWEEDEIAIDSKGGTLQDEKNKLQEALNKAASSVEKLLHQKSENKTKTAILKAHLAILQDPELQKKAFRNLKENISAAKSWWELIQKEVQILSELKDERLSGRAIDIKDIGKTVLRYLDPNAVRSYKTDIQTPSVIVSLDMAPSQTSQLERSKVLALVTAKGGSTSHTAIIARSMEIASIAGIGEEVLKVKSKQVIVDGDTGVMVIKPTQKDIELAKQLQKELVAKKSIEFDLRFKPAVTTDKHRVEVVANIGSADEALEAINNGSEGVGLVRTEFLFLKRDKAPNEVEQFFSYKKMVQHMIGLPLVIRTLDIGGDKEVPYLHIPKEDNPFLGVRGIRLCLEHKELFKEQLRAIYKARKYGPIRIMFPMVGLVEEFREAKAMAEEVREEVDAEPIEIGMMIEVPSAVLMAEHFAKEAAFFSVGTNDLTQYVLSMDRGHQKLAKKADALHPAVLKMIKTLCDVAQQNGKWVGVCGNLAANPLGAKILTGFGVKELSMTSSAVPKIKALIRESSLKECKELADKALMQESAFAVRALENI
jgi:multiphosphoryl transfer protein